MAKRRTPLPHLGELPTVTTPRGRGVPGRVGTGLVGTAIVAALLAAAGCGGTVAGRSATTAHRSAPRADDQVRESPTTLAPTTTTTVAPTSTTTAIPTTTAVTTPKAPAAVVPPTTAAVTKPPPPPVTVQLTGGVTAVGDSVMLDAAPDLQSDIPGIDVNAAVSRQWATGETVVEQLRSAGQLGATVVVDLGTNGPITTTDFDTMMADLAGVTRVVFVTVHVDRPWQAQVNGVLAAGVPRYPNAALADWAGLAAAHPEWFYTDGTHLPIGGPGAQALAALIASACG